MERKRKGRRQNKQDERPTQLGLFGPIEGPPAIRSDEPMLTEFSGRPIRLVIIDAAPWWVLSDVAKVLGYRDARDASRLLRDKHKGTHQMRTPGGTQEFLVVSEPGLYRLMMRSERPEAEAFQDWVTDEVLPTIRKTGKYECVSARTRRYARAMKTTDATSLQHRLEVVNQHKEVNRQLADEGFKPNDFRRFYNTRYETWVGKTASDLKVEGGFTDSPLNHLGDILLFESSHALALTRRLVEMRAEERGRLLTPEEQSEIFAESITDIRDADLTKLGGVYGFRDDPKRGRVLDVVRAIPAANARARSIAGPAA